MAMAMAVTMVGAMAMDVFYMLSLISFPSQFTFYILNGGGYG